jgi:release factor glutamine methyltransferase
MSKLVKTILIIASVGCVLLMIGWWAQTSLLTHVSQEHEPTFSSNSSRLADGIDPNALHIKAWHILDEFPQDIAQFETVFWEPQDTTSLRAYLADYAALRGARVLEIGTGTGLISLFCAQRGADSVLATDINPQAVANARYNAEMFGLTHSLTVRLVAADRPGPFAVIQQDEQFDLIISNPPWEDAIVSEVAAAALYDPDFALLDGLLEQGGEHLLPGGKLLLAYGARTAIERILARGPRLGWQVTLHDNRTLASLPEVFVPGMLLELSTQ